MCFKNRWNISSSYDFQAHQQPSPRRWCFSQTAQLWFEVLPDMLPALQGLSLALPGAPRLVVGAPRIVAGAPSYSEGWQECLPRVWYSPEIDTSKFALHILSDTPLGFQWLKYILLMVQGLSFSELYQSLRSPHTTISGSGWSWPHSWQRDLQTSHNWWLKASHMPGPLPECMKLLSVQCILRREWGLSHHQRRAHIVTDLLLSMQPIAYRLRLNASCSVYIHLLANSII